MSRIHISLNTHRFEDSIAFYSTLFGQGPAKQRADWAKFDIQVPAVNLTLNRSDTPAPSGAISHLGVEVEDADTVKRINDRLISEGLTTVPEENTTCCYALQDKTWVTDPSGNAWEFFYVKGDV